MQSMSSTYSAVELIDLWKKFEDSVAVKGISMTIPQGEFFSMLGPSGSGKTTVLRLIAGFESPTAGAVWAPRRTCPSASPIGHSPGDDQGSVPT